MCFLARDAFSANVKFGGLLDQDEIKILICYLISVVKEGLSKNDIVSIINDNKLANYFEVMEALSALVKDGHIQTSVCDDDGSELYISTKTGDMISSQLDSMVPISVREKVVASSITLLSKKKAKKENYVSSEKTEDGFRVRCIIPGSITDLLDLNIYVPDSMQARKVKENFLRNSELIYSVLLAFFSDDMELLNSNIKRLKQKMMQDNWEADK